MSAARARSDPPVDAWRGFSEGRWRTAINVRDFVVGNTHGFADGPEFLTGPSPCTRAVWAKITPLIAEQIRRGVLDVDTATPSTIVSHAPGYIDRATEVIVGLQIECPFRRAVMPNGGLHMIEVGSAAAGFTPDPRVVEIFTKQCKTHNDGVFDAYTPEILGCRRSGIITGLPDAYGRGRIIGDYRRVALYGVRLLL